MKCQTCSMEFEGESWQKFCKACYAKTVKAEGAVTIKIGVAALTKDESILRMSLLKLASEQNPRATPADVFKFAKELRSEWDKW